MKFRPKIDGHDYDTKMKHVERFLDEGSKVKLTIMFRGREMAHPELGRRILERVADEVAELAIVESAPTPGRPQHDDGAATRLASRRRKGQGAEGRTEVRRRRQRAPTEHRRPPPAEPRPVADVAARPRARSTSCRR